MNSKQSENLTASATARANRAEQPSLNDEQPSKTAALMYRPGLSPEILEGRIRFAERWELRKRAILSLPEPRTERGEEWSHPETFYDWHGRIVQIVNNYGSPPPAILEMKPVGCLYREDATSYAARFSTLKELRARLEAAEGSGEKLSAARHLFTEPPAPRRSRLQGRGKVTA